MKKFRIPASSLAALLLLAALPQAAHAASGTWTQTTSGGLWSDTANWSGGTIADASSFTANFNTLDITADNTVRLDSARTLTSLIFGDTDNSSAASWILDNNATPANILTLAGTTPTITVNALGTNQTATISAVIAGTVGLTKAGVGTLVLSGDNTNTGTTAVGAGTLTLGANRTATASTFAVGSVASSTGTLNIQGNLTLATGANQINAGGTNGGVGIINQTGGTVGFSDTVSIGVVVGQALGGTGTYNLSAGTLTPPSTSGVGIALCNNNASTGTFNLSGSGNLAAGSSTLNIGRWNITSVQNTTPTFNQTGGTATIGTLFLGGRGQNCQATLNLTGGTFTVTTFGGILGNANKASNVAMTVGGTATATLPAFPVKTTGNTATFTFDGGTLVVGAASASYMQAPTFDTATITSNGGTIQADSGNDATIAQIFGGAGPLTKTGIGTLTLTGANTYMGATTVSNGTLLVNGSLHASSAVTVGTGTGGTLGGTGTINGSVTVAADGNLAPGASAGTLSISGGLDISAPANGGSGKLQFELGADTATSDQLAVSGTLTIGLGVLGFSDFTFSNLLGGPQDGTYVLITSGGINPGDTLNGSDLSGPIGGIGVGTLGISGNNIVLNVTGLVGAVDNFLISAIASPQTVGTPITGITLTARDATNNTATSFTGTVTFGGTGGFSGTSANFVLGVLNSVSVTPTVAGSNLTLTVDDDSGPSIGSTTITTIQTQYQFWAGGALFDADANGDGVKNGLAFLLGASGPNVAVTLPTVTQSGGDLVLSNFSSRNLASRGTATLSVQHSSDLDIGDPWTTVLVPEATAAEFNGVSYNITPGSPLNTVNTATISVSQSAAGKLFGRLEATQP